jgi:hypothetical protein
MPIADCQSFELPIADCQLPIFERFGDLKLAIGNRQLAITALA